MVAMSSEGSASLICFLHWIKSDIPPERIGAAGPLSSGGIITFDPGGIITFDQRENKSEQNHCLIKELFS
jgi:hypothetical protein